METPFLDQLIDEHQNHIESVEVASYAGIPETRKQLAELEAIKAIIVTHCCETLKDEGQATLTEYATELINMQENPQDSNKEWKIVVMQNTIGKLHETIKSL